MDGVLDANVWCPLRSCVFDAKDVERVGPQVSSKGETCITGDVRSIARRIHGYHPIKSFLNVAKSAFVNGSETKTEKLRGEDSIESVCL